MKRTFINITILQTIMSICLFTQTMNTMRINKIYCSKLLKDINTTKKKMKNTTILMIMTKGEKITEMLSIRRYPMFVTKITEAKII